jgi:hypothetical protein
MKMSPTPYVITQNKPFAKYNEDELNHTLTTKKKSIFYSESPNKIAVIRGNYDSASQYASQMKY